MNIAMTSGAAFASRPCPLCATQSGGKAEVASIPAAEAKPYDSLIPYWNGFFKDKVFFSYERCPSCHLLYTPQFFDAKQLAQLYAQMPPNMDLVPVDALRRTQKGYFDILKRHAPLENSYMEVGPDIGLFTANCVREGHFDKYWLFEPNRAVWPVLEQTMQGTTHEITPDMFGFARVPDKSVGVAVLIQVLDHLLDPVTTLKEIHEKLVPGGTLIIVTHDESSGLRRLFGRRWPAFCLQHPQLYNPSSMRAIVKTAGYETIAVERTVNYFPLQFLFKHLLWALGIKAKSVPSFAQMVLGLRLGNMLTVAKVPGQA